MTPVYKILTAEQWAEWQADGRFEGSPADLTDGFIHLSAAEQVAGTRAKWFPGQEMLVLATVDGDRLADLRWEPARGGALFPHSYQPIPLDAVVETRALTDD